MKQPEKGGRPRYQKLNSAIDTQQNALYFAIFAKVHFSFSRIPNKQMTALFQNLSSSAFNQTP